MSREAIEEEFDVFLDEMVAYAREAFSPTRAATGRKGLGDKLLKGAFSRKMDEELGSIRRDMERQRDVVLDYVEDEDPDMEEYRDRFLRSNPLYKNFSGWRREELVEDLTDHFEEVADQLEPLVAYEDEEDEDLYDALRATYDREEAEAILEGHFEQADRFEEYRGQVDMTVEVGSFPLSTEVDVMDEVIRVLDGGEAYLKEEMVRPRLDTVYGE